MMWFECRYLERMKIAIKAAKAMAPGTHPQTLFSRHNLYERSNIAKQIWRESEINNSWNTYIIRPRNVLEIYLMNINGNFQKVFWHQRLHDSKAILLASTCTLTIAMAVFQSDFLDILVNIVGIDGVVQREGSWRWLDIQLVDGWVECTWQTMAPKILLSFSLLALHTCMCQALHHFHAFECCKLSKQCLGFKD